MNTNNLEKQLQSMQFTFSNNFNNEVIAEINKLTLFKTPKIKLFIASLAACIIFCLGFIYIQEGSISYDHLLGIDILNSTNSLEIFNYL